MELKNNFIEIDTADNPDLGDYLNRKDIGAVCEMKIKFKMTQRTPEGAKGSILSLEPLGDGYAKRKGDERVIRPDVTSPVSVVMGRNKAASPPPPMPSISPVSGMM